MEGKHKVESTYIGIEENDTWQYVMSVRLQVIDAQHRSNFIDL